MCILNIIGCGRVGKTLGRLWFEQGLARIGDVANRSRQSSERAVAFIGAGRPVGSLGEIRPADIHLLGTSDDSIGAVAAQLADLGVVRPNDMVFHCSGALSSEILLPLRRQGAILGSVHPVKSFADPQVALATFDGTFCAVEGDPLARDVLQKLLTGIGARVFSIESKNKIIYHAATGFACSCLTAMLELSSQCFLKAGIEAGTAMQLMEPLVRETAANVLRLGPAQALTGPISRGDCGLVASQLAALSAWQPEIGDIYRLLGKVALRLSREKGSASETALKKIEELLERE